MKKIFFLTLLSLFLVSCGKQEVTETNSGAMMTGSDMSGMTMTGTEMLWGDQSWAVVSGDDQAKDPTTSADVSQWNPWDTASSSGKTEDQIVKDFEKDLDGILNSIDNGSSKK